LMRLCSGALDGRRLRQRPGQSSFKAGCLVAATPAAATSWPCESSYSLCPVVPLTTEMSARLPPALVLMLSRMRT
jgi:hypothetical protein